MRNPVKTVEHAGCSIQIFQDEYSENPIQEFDGAHVQIWHRHYDFGNSKQFDTPQDAREFFEAQGDKVVWLPVYLFDHSGLTVNTTGFSCPWDSGQVGWVWITKDEAAQLMGPTEPTEEEIQVLLRDTVRLLDDFLTGRVYGYAVQDDHGAEIDSCWGYFGDPERSGLLDEARQSAEHHATKKYAKTMERQVYAI